MGVYIGGIPNLITSQIQGPCPSGFHVPTIYERTRVINILREMGGDNNGGYVSLKLPNAYYRNYAGNALSTNIFSAGGYWSCTPKRDSPYNAYNFRWTAQGGGRYNSGRGLGLYIRPFKDIVAIPDSSRTTIVSNSQGSIMWDQTNGLISLGNTYGNWITMADKNLGATQVYNSNDTKSQNNCGNFFQWGNNNPFPWDGTITTSTTKVDASNYGPGNYYTGSTFIRGTNSTLAYWDSSNNPNLWGGVTGALPSELGAGSLGTTGISNIYVGDLKVRPEDSSNRIPGNHTKAYRPLNSTTTINDQSGNGYNLTQTGGTFGVYNGVDCFYNGGANSGYFMLTSGSNIPSGRNPRTISFWIYPTGYSNTYAWGFFRCGKTGSSNYSHYRLGVNFGEVPVAVRCQNGQDTITGSSIPTSGWSLITVVLTPLRYQLYINGQLNGSSTSYVDTSVISDADPLTIMNGNSAGTINGNYQTRGYINEFIIEDTPWSPNKILAYYNQTKTAHGIS